MSTETVKGPIFKGETGKVIVYTLKNRAGKPVDLTDYTGITLIIKRPSDGQEFERTCEVHGDPKNGQVRFVTNDLTKFTECGSWSPKVRLTKSGVCLYWKPVSMEDGIFVEDPDDLPA